MDAKQAIAELRAKFARKDAMKKSLHSEVELELAEAV
jgi:predicted Ser/Thr protein kinase